jgi:hypothetical protein
MKANDVYRLLAIELDAVAHAQGFRKIRGSRLAYQRATAGAYQTIWFQCDRQGWDQYAGSRFFANFTVSTARTYDVGGRHEGLFYFLSDTELEGARDFRDSVVRRIPRPPESYFEMLREQFARYPDGSEMVAALRAQFEPEPIPYRRNQDAGMRYWLPTDVQWWGRLIASTFPRILAEMTKWSIDDIGAGA